MGCREGSAGPEVLIEITGAELVQRIAHSDSDFTLVNVWATWCGPCREEFPYIQSVTRSFEDRGVALVFVSTDFPSEREATLEFLRSQKADLPSYLKMGSDQEFIDALAPEWSGAMPATFIFDARGARVKTWFGKVEQADLRATLRRLTDNPAHQRRTQ